MHLRSLLLLYVLTLSCFLLFSARTSTVMAQDGGASKFENFFERPDAFRARYTELKHIPTLTNPLRSEGDFIYIKDIGIGWLMDQPFSMQTLIGANGLMQYVDGEKQPQSEKMQKTMAPIMRNIVAMFSGDFSALAHGFEITQQPANGDIKMLRLVPISSNLKPYLQEINLKGVRYIEEIKIVYAADKYTIVHYETPRIGAASITDKERRLFE